MRDVLAATEFLLRMDVLVGVLRRHFYFYLGRSLCVLYLMSLWHKVLVFESRKTAYFICIYLLN